jgi:hypothetical protein
LGDIGGEVFMAKPYFQGGRAKYEKINDFRIIGQGTLLVL